MPLPSAAHEDKKQREKRIEGVRSRAVDEAMQQGFVLTRYFFDQFSTFEKNEVGFQDAFPDMLYNLDLGREEKRARDVTFAKESAPDLMRQTVRPNADSLDAAEERLIAGDAPGAQEIAQKALENNSGDIARANFILARAASMQGKMQDAIDGFQRALQFSRDPRTLAWSHIYLARIFDIQEDRETALKHYNAALNTGDQAPDTKAAAERGLQKPYELPARK
jgi:tetratricopeptide (TPR) repeat protein